MFYAEGTRIDTGEDIRFVAIRDPRQNIRFRYVRLFKDGRTLSVTLDGEGVQLSVRFLQRFEVVINPWHRKRFVPRYRPAVPVPSVIILMTVLLRTCMLCLKIVLYSCSVC